MCLVALMSRATGTRACRVVLDLGSTNLTRVNGEIVRERALSHGDELRFGRARCRFEAASAPADPVASGV